MCCVWNVGVVSVSGFLVCCNVTCKFGLHTMVVSAVVRSFLYSVEIQRSLGSGIPCEEWSGGVLQQFP